MFYSKVNNTEYQCICNLFCTQFSEQCSESSRREFLDPDQKVLLIWNWAENGGKNSVRQKESIQFFPKIGSNFRS